MLLYVAGLFAVAHLLFACLEVFCWGPKFVKFAAPSWMLEPDAAAHVAWAKKLALNMGAYNLVLAIGLAWTAVSQPSSLGLFFTMWLLIAALAAAWTRVWRAAVAQGVMGLLLGAVSL
jgi:uncharacterized membrane protein